MFLLTFGEAGVSRFSDLKALPGTDDRDAFWIHLQGDMAAARAFLENSLSVDDESIDVLCDELTRPRLCVNSHEELLLTIRVLRSEVEASPQMASLRALISENYLITLSYVELPVVTGLADKLVNKSQVPHLPVQVMGRICDTVTDQITGYVMDLDVLLTEMEEQWEEVQSLSVSGLHRLRMEASRVRRFLLPQMEAFIRVVKLIEDSGASTKDKRTQISRWREMANATKRDMEMMGEMRERVSILRDALHQKTNEATNRIMFLISMVATFFLPLTFVASLFGMNVSGMPLGKTDGAFWWLCGFMLIVSVVQWWLFKRWKWLR